MGQTHKTLCIVPLLRWPNSTLLCPHMVCATEDMKGNLVFISLSTPLTKKGAQAWIFSKKKNKLSSIADLKLDIKTTARSETWDAKWTPGTGPSLLTREEWHTIFYFMKLVCPWLEPFLIHVALNILLSQFSSLHDKNSTKYNYILWSPRS